MVSIDTGLESHHLNLTDGELHDADYHSGLNSNLTAHLLDILKQSGAGTEESHGNY